MTIDQLMETATAHHRAGRLAEAEMIYRRVLSQHPDHADALHLLGVLAHQIGRNHDAVDLIRRAISLRRDVSSYYSNWGIALGALGRLSDAIAAHRHAVTLDPQSGDAHNNLARSLIRNNQTAEALAEFQAALAIQPNDAEVLANLSNVFRQTEDYDRAVEYARRAIVLRPNLSSAYNNLGAALHLKSDFDGAADAYRRAIAITGTGAEAADVHHNLGITLHRAGRLEEAIEALRRATELQPGRVESFHQLSYALRDRGRLAEAIAAARSATTLNPAHSGAHNNLGIIFCEVGSIDDAIAAFRRAIELQPDFGGAYNNLGNALKDTGLIEEAVVCYRQAARFDPRSPVVENFLYSIHFHPGYDAYQIAREHALWNEQYAKPLASQIAPHTNDRSPERRLRVGYVSRDLREHPVGRFLLPLLASHDHGRFEVFCYTDVTRPDAVTGRLKSHSDAWRITSGLSEEALAERVRADGIDILVDLAMHMDGTRMLTFARKPAPVQVTYLAYCSTTGLETIDYRLTDPYLDPPGMDESIYSEKSVRLPHTYWCYEPPASAPPVGPPRTAAGGPIKFGSLNNFGKVSPAAMRAWMHILARVPGSELILHTGEGAHRQRLVTQFAQAGIAPDRITFFARIPIDQYMQLYNTIDVALDPFPYPGGTTTCDALWMGTPVVTLAGPTAASRGGVSLLSNMGLTDLIADSADRYVQVASDLAGNVNRLAELRITLRDRMRRSPLMDARGFARDVENAYRRMWRTWCEAPDHARKL
jgi:predicted O-linked N-acetylglucosamine transferase (SPINDLY family)